MSCVRRWLLTGALREKHQAAAGGMTLPMKDAGGPSVEGVNENDGNGTRGAEPRFVVSLAFWLIYAAGVTALIAIENSEPAAAAVAIGAMLIFIAIWRVRPTLPRPGEDRISLLRRIGLLLAAALLNIAFARAVQSAFAAAAGAVLLLILAIRLYGMPSDGN